jgi:hypothetical protein
VAFIVIRTKIEVDKGSDPIQMVIQSLAFSLLTGLPAVIQRIALCKAFSYQKEAE